MILVVLVWSAKTIVVIDLEAFVSFKAFHLLFYWQLVVASLCPQVGGIRACRAGSRTAALFTPLVCLEYFR